MVLQDTWLFHGTIRTTLRTVVPHCRRKSGGRGKPTYVDRFVHSLPDGYDTVIDEEAKLTSARVKQLVTIARSLPHADPALLILDKRQARWIPAPGPGPARHGGLRSDGRALSSLTGCQAIQERRRDAGNGNGKSSNKAAPMSCWMPAATTSTSTTLSSQVSPKLQRSRGVRCLVPGPLQRFLNGVRPTIARPSRPSIRL